MTYAIEKGVPVKPRGGRKILYPLDEMEIGDSFFVPDRDHSDICPVIAARRKARQWDRKFTTRIEPGGIRVWRVE